MQNICGSRNKLLTALITHRTFENILTPTPLPNGKQPSNTTFCSKLTRSRVDKFDVLQKA